MESGGIDERDDQHQQLNADLPDDENADIPVEEIDCGAPWQFSLLTLLGTTTLCAVFLALGTDVLLLTVWMVGTTVWLALQHSARRSRRKRVALVYAQAAEDKGDYDRAAAILARVLLFHPRDLELLLKLRQFHADRKDWPAALEYATQLVDRIPGNLRYLFARAELYESSGNPAAAWKDYELALEIAPDDAEAWARLALAHRSAGRHEQAVEALKTSLELEPGVSERWTLLMNEYEVLGLKYETDWARQRMKEAIKHERKWMET